MSIFDLFTERKSNSANNRYHSKFNRNAVRSRNLRLESLEERALLSAVPLSSSEYADLRAQYTEFNLPENMADLNVITLDLAEGDNLSTLKAAVVVAGQTKKSDLIVVRTTNTANMLTYSSNTDEISMSLNSSRYGSVTIVGWGSHSLSLNADQQCRVITVSGKRTIANLGGLTIMNGQSLNSSIDKFYGGGIHNSGRLMISNSTISGNTASYEGGGIHNSGRLAISNSFILENSASRGGGGICNNSDTLMVTNSTISGNIVADKSTAWGGGIKIIRGTVTIANSMISGNVAKVWEGTGSASGGGIYNISGTITVMNSTISENTVSSDGGGIRSSGLLTITNSTIWGNIASVGGGIESSGTSMIKNSTISGNSASRQGGGICSFLNTTGARKETVTNCIISQNYASKGANISGALSTSSHNNLIGYYGQFVNDPIFDSKGKLINAEFVDLHLRSDSRAINTGDNSIVSELMTDMEGNPRIYMDIVDIGAYEYQEDRNDAPISYSSVVDTLNDSFDLNDGEWSLREALYYAPEYITITFAPDLNGTITLIQGQLVVDKAVCIDGDGRIAIDANQKSRVISIEAGTEETPVILNGLNIQNGKTNDNGGGIYNDSCRLTVTSCTFSGNTSSHNGGGIFSEFDSILTVTNSTIGGNSASRGSGIYSREGTTTVMNCLILRNSVSHDGTIQCHDYYTNRSLTIFNCVVSQNIGVGIFTVNTLMQLANCTIVGNSSQGICCSGKATKTILNNSIITANLGGNLDGNRIIVKNNITTIRNPGFMYLPDFANYEEWLNVRDEEWDLTLKANSIAIDRGNNKYLTEAGGSAFSTDLIGNCRISNKKVDLGAYEYPQYPNIESPAVSAVIEGKNVYVSWDSVPNAISFDVQYRVADTDKWTVKKSVKTNYMTFPAKLDATYEINVMAISRVPSLDNSAASFASVKCTQMLDSLKLKTTYIGDDNVTISVTGLSANATCLQVKLGNFIAQVPVSGDSVNIGSAECSFYDGVLTFTGLENSTKYALEVQQVIAEPYAAIVRSAVTKATISTTKTCYNTPQNVTVLELSDTEVMVSWDSVTGKHSTQTATHYTVQYSIVGSRKWSNATTKAIGNSFIVTKLKGGTSYEFRIFATKDSAFEASAPSAVMTAETLAMPTVTLDKTSVTDEAFQTNVTNYQITNLVDATTMNIVTDQFGAATIELQNKAGSVAFANGMTAEFTNGALTFTNAPSNTALKVQISFTKADCTTALSAAVSVKTIMAAYNKPVLTNAIAISSTSITVEWETVYGKNSTKAAQKYTIQYSTDGAKWTNATTSATGTSFTIQKLKPNTKYLIAVIANKDQWFNASEPSDSLIIRTLDN